MIVQLLEREACLVSLAGYADEARHGEGRLVLVAEEACVGKSALVEQLRATCPMPAGREVPAMSCSPRAH